MFRQEENTVFSEAKRAKAKVRRQLLWAELRDRRINRTGRTLVQLSRRVLSPEGQKNVAGSRPNPAYLLEVWNSYCSPEDF